MNKFFLLAFIISGISPAKAIPQIVGENFLISGKVNTPAISENTAKAVSWLEKRLRRPVHARNFSSSLSKDINYSAGSIGIFCAAVLQPGSRAKAHPSKVWRNVQLSGKLIQCLASIKYEHLSPKGRFAPYATFIAVNNVSSQMLEIVPAFHGINPRAEIVIASLEKIRQLSRSFVRMKYLDKASIARKKATYDYFLLNIKKQTDIVIK